MAVRSHFVDDSWFDVCHIGCITLWGMAILIGSGEQTGALYVLADKPSYLLKNKQTELYFKIQPVSRSKHTPSRL
jgi:hypothetical protein